MDFLTDWITEFIKNMLIDGIMANLSGVFDNVNNQIGQVAAQVGTPPASWNPAVFSLIRNLSETVVLPIAGLILTFIATYELISMIVEKNNLHDVAQHVVSNASGLIAGNTAVTLDMMTDLETSLQSMDIGPLIGLWLQTIFVGFTMQALNIVIFIIVYGRLMEIYMLTSLAPIPFATLSNKEFGGMGQNYFKSLCAIGFQGFLIMVCIAIYAVLIQGIATGGDSSAAVWTVVGYTVLLCFTLFKTGSITKTVLGAH